tara:strand:+ start:9479 stop:10177 length:699 start_codon:yes stop_codon:yes gene_type:complete
MQNNTDYQQYVNTLNGFITTINNNVANLNRSNEIVANMFYSMDRAYNNQPNDMVYFSVNNNRRRRLNMPSRTLSPVSNIPEQELPVPSIEQEQPIPSIEQEQPVLSIEPIPPSNNDGYRQLSINNLTTVINDNIRKMKYGDIVNPIDTVCAITQEEFENDNIVGVFNNCNHIFNYDALLNWIVRDQTCPCCRRNILANTNIISYVEPQTHENLFLTIPQFSRYLLGDLLSGN